MRIRILILCSTLGATGCASAPEAALVFTGHAVFDELTRNRPTSETVELHQRCAGDAQCLETKTPP